MDNTIQQENVDAPMPGDVAPPQESLDINNLPERKIGEKIEKPHLDGKEVKISKVELTPTGDVRKSKDGSKDMETILFKVYYALEGVSDEQYENYGGVTRFVRPDGSKSDVSIYWQGNSASAKLFKQWLTFVNKAAEITSYKEFFKDIVGLRVRLKEYNVTYQGTESHKNVVEEILGR